MNEMDFENKLHALANGMEYPRTPDVAGRLRTATRSRFRLTSKALAWSLTIILVLCSSLMLIPPARAAIIEFIQIGVVRIFPQPVTPTVEAIRTVTPQALAPVTAKVSSTPISLIPILNRMAGKTTLVDAQKKVDFPILLPSYPANLGQPDYVYVQDANGAMVVLVWLTHQHPDQVLMSLHIISNESWVINKMGPNVIQETQVNSQHAIWAEGPYPLILRNGNVEFTRLIDGHVLIWTGVNVTYRLETDLSMEEALKVAESLQPIPAP